jgi:hypothetical protein
MTNKLLRVALLSLLACACLGAQQTTAGAPQQFTVLRTGRLIAPSENATNADTNCSIIGAGGAATMQCHPAPATVSTSYHYNTTLIVDEKGTGYVIACRAALVTNFWCKKAEAGTTIQGQLQNGHLAVMGGDKPHDYSVLTSANVGPLPVIQVPQPPEKKAQVQSKPSPTPPAPAQPVAAAPVMAAKKPADNPEKSSGDASLTCTSPSGACVNFISEPLGADIYVDGKFAGNTPSALNLAPGSHDIRIESGKRTPWTRKLDVTAGSKITVRATLEASAASN